MEETKKKVTNRGNKKNSFKVKKNNPNAIIPKQADGVSAGFDLFVCEDTWVDRGRNIVSTGISISLPKGIDGHIRPRSGFSVKGMEGFRYKSFFSDELVKGRFDADVIQGTIDCGYHGDIGVIVRNNDRRFMLEAGTRIAQIVFNRHELPTLDEVDSLDGYDRGGGFGHSGTK